MLLLYRVFISPSDIYLPPPSFLLPSSGKRSKFLEREKKGGTIQCILVALSPFFLGLARNEERRSAQKRMSPLCLVRLYPFLHSFRPNLINSTIVSLFDVSVSFHPFTFPLCTLTILLFKPTKKYLPTITMTISINMESELGPPLPPYQQAAPQWHKRTFTRRLAKRLFLTLISLTALFLAIELYHLDKTKLPTNWRSLFSSSPSSPSSSTPSSAPPQAPVEARP